MKSDVLILAGGKSKRMGGIHKGNLMAGADTFQLRLIRELSVIDGQMFLSYGAISRGGYKGCQVLFDEVCDCGPLGGIVTGLRHASTDLVAVTACDMPFMKASFFEYLYHCLEDAQRREQKEFLGVVPVSGGKIHPLAAIYRKSSLGDFEKALSEKRLKIISLIESMDLLFLDLTGNPYYEKMLVNINTPEDYKKIIERKKQRMKEQLTLEEATESLLGRTKFIEETEEISLWDAANRVLAEDLLATRDQPPFSRSPLDGYALRSEDIQGASRKNPKSLRVIDEVMAGYMSHKVVEPGTAIRIMTGAPIPEGADCVIRQEDTDYGEEYVQIYAELKPYQNYCFKGEDYKEGTILLKRGCVLKAIDIGVIAGTGKTSVSVYRRPRISVFVTGDEVCLPGEELLEGKIYDNNLHTMVSQLKIWDAQIIERARLLDSPVAVANALKDALNKCDLIFTSGGVSVGKKDIMHEALELAGADKIFWKVLIKPGMPTLCAEYQGKLIICLSGNPYGAAVNLNLLGRPVLAKMTGRSDLKLTRKKALLCNSYSKRSRVTRYVRAYYEDGKVWIADGSNDSGVLSNMCGCNCLIELPAGSEPATCNLEVTMILL